MENAPSLTSLTAVNLCNRPLDPGLPSASWKSHADSGRTSELLYQTVYCCEMRARVRVKAMKLIPSGITPLPQVRPRMRSRRLYHTEKRSSAEIRRLDFLSEISNHLQENSRLQRLPVSRVLNKPDIWLDRRRSQSDAKTTCTDE